MYALKHICRVHLTVLELENESFTDPLESDTELEGVNPGSATSEIRFSLKRNAALMMELCLICGYIYPLPMPELQ